MPEDSTDDGRTVDGPGTTDASESTDGIGSNELGFTFDRYERLLREVKAEGYDFGRYGDGLDPGTVLLRHDVDLSPRRALRTAEIEHDLDVRATYFFLVASPMYNVLDEDTRRVLGTIGDLGHDVGLHFSTHQYWSPGEIPGDAAVADRVGTERDVLSAVADPIETVSFHVPPDPVLRHEFDAFPSTYEPRFFTEIGYVADSNQRWRTDPPRVESFPETTQLLVHPGLWGESDDAFGDRVQQAVEESGARTREYAHGRYVAQRFG
jgi:hypothetical protein